HLLAALSELSQRALVITGSREVEANVHQTLEDLRTYWLNMTRSNVGTQLGYRTRKDGHTIGLLRQPGQGDWSPFTCLNSLRDVEPSINLILDERGLGDIVVSDPGSEGGVNGGEPVS